MTKKQFEAFEKFRSEYKKLCMQWNVCKEELQVLQKKAAEKDTPEYSLENAVVYNVDYDKITEKDEIHLIVIGDNPGKEEQFNKNQRFLVGQSGRIAEGFFARNPELKTDFRKNVIIMNKTPVHTAKTVHLKYLLKNGSKEIQDLIKESQIKMAVMAAEFHQALVENADENAMLPELWLVGYSELKKKGIFELYREEFKNAYKDKTNEWSYVFVYQHFSMNRFIVDLNSYRAENQSESLKSALKKIGLKHKKEIFEQ